MKKIFILAGAAFLIPCIASGSMLDRYKNIKDGTTNEKIAIIKKIEKDHDKDGLDALIEGLGDKETVVQAHAIVAINSFKEEAFPSLLDAVKSSNSFIRGNAANILGNIKDKRGNSALVSLLYDKERFVKNNALIALGKTGDAELVKDINVFLSKETDPSVRITAVSMLSIFRDKSSIDILISVMSNDENIKVREEAVKVLGEYRDVELIKPLLLAMNKNSDSVKNLIVKDFSMFDRKKLIPNLKDALKDPSLKLSAIYALGRINEREGVGMLIDLLKSDDLEVLKGAVVSLGVSSDRNAVTPLSDLLKYHKKEIRLETALALGKIKDEGAVKPLADAIHDVDKDVQTAVISALGDIGGEGALKELTSFYQNTASDDLRAKADVMIKRLEHR